MACTTKLTIIYSQVEMQTQKYWGHKYNQNNNQDSSCVQFFFHYPTRLTWLPVTIIKIRHCSVIICFQQKPVVILNKLSWLQCRCQVERSIKTFILRNSIEQIKDFILNIFNVHDSEQKAPIYFSVCADYGSMQIALQSPTINKIIWQFVWMAKYWWLVSELFLSSFLLMKAGYCEACHIKPGESIDKR